MTKLVGNNQSLASILISNRLWRNPTNRPWQPDRHMAVSSSFLFKLCKDPVLHAVSGKLHNAIQESRQTLSSALCVLLRLNVTWFSMLHLFGTLGPLAPYSWLLPTLVTCCLVVSFTSQSMLPIELRAIKPGKTLSVFWLKGQPAGLWSAFSQISGEGSASSPSHHSCSCSRSD